MTNAQLCLIIDISLVGVILISAIIGRFRGLVAQIVGLGSKLVALIGATVFFKKLGAVIGKKYLYQKIYDIVLSKTSESLVDSGGLGGDSATIPPLSSEYAGMLENFGIEIPSGAEGVDGYAESLAATVAEKISSVLSSVIAFVGLFLAIWAICALLGCVLRGLFSLKGLKKMNKVGGLLLGAMSGVLICVVLCGLAPSIIATAFPEEGYSLGSSYVYSLFSEFGLTKMLSEKVQSYSQVDVASAVDSLTGFGQG